MERNNCSNEYTVKLRLQIPGPLYPRRKYQQHKLLTAEGNITLPFVPYPGLYVTFSKPHPKKKDTIELYLRIRTVEWRITERIFECIADEILASSPNFELEEVRGSPRIEKHFLELQKTFKLMGFNVTNDMKSYFMALHKMADGTAYKSS